MWIHGFALIGRRCTNEDAMKRPRLNIMVLSGGGMVLLLAALAALAPWLSPYEPDAIDVTRLLIGPSSEHLLGTDQLGRDVLSRMLYGARISLTIGFIAVGIAAVIGVCVGAVAGYYGGRVDSFIMRGVDMMMCFPTFFLILAVVALDPSARLEAWSQQWWGVGLRLVLTWIDPGLLAIMVIIGVTGWMGMARLVRAEVLTLREREYVQAARAMGATDVRIIFRHLLPNAINPVLVSVILGVGGAILVESSLSFLGIGVQPPTASWGNILIEAKSTLGSAWWLTVWPGAAILTTVLSFNLLGEGLRDLMGPRR